MAGLADRLKAAEQAQKPSCSTCAWLMELGQEDQDALADVLTRKVLSVATVVEILRELGHETSDTSLRRHVRKCMTSVTD